MTLRTDAVERIRGGVHERLAHDSARKHVTGKAVYIDDTREPDGLLHVFVAHSPHAHGRITKLDVAAVERAPGVAATLTPADIPGSNDFGREGLGDDRVFAGDLVEYAGQALFAVVADTPEQARVAAAQAVVAYDLLPPILSVGQAVAAGSYVKPPRRLSRGDSRAALESSRHRLQGRFSTGAQDHFYLEGQVSLAVPGEDGTVQLHCSTQDPSAVQHIVARILGSAASAVTVEVRRMGGAFGGKETQATHFAAIAALAAIKTGRPVKCRLDRDDDMIITGKRHEFTTDYDVGFDETGRITGLELQLYVRCGNSLDQSSQVVNRAIFHVDNCYFLEHVCIDALLCKTNTVTAVAFRGFGTPQAMAIAERVIERIAYHLGLDPLAVRKVNLYGKSERNTTPFDAVVRDNILPELLAELEASADYHRRREEIRRENLGSQWLKKGISLVPIKYGVGFGVNFKSQAGALLHVYRDGSVHLNHGGTEMGQGLFVKVAQVVAEELQVDVEKVRISATATDKVANTFATAASSGTDLNAAAAQIAARKIRARLRRFASEHFKVEDSRISFLPNRVRLGNQEMSFAELADLASMNRLSLSATGHYSSPKTNYNPEKPSGQPHRYYAYGAAVAEVLVDTLTGEHKVTRVDILHDVGRSLNPSVDLGQLEGGFMQGVGWLTSEEVVWDGDGVLRTHAPSTYKIPTCSDRPRDFRMRLAEWSTNSAESVHRSKAVGEPPLTLAISVLGALTDALASIGDYRRCPSLNAPATPEAVLTAAMEQRAALDEAQSVSR